ncbi:MAG: hypothetical protein RIT45_1484 [Pseudomonadota bacterium]
MLRFRTLALGLCALAALVATPAFALVGTHGPAITSFDSRASSVALSASHRMFNGQALTTLTYNTAFSSTTGRLSSQFGAHALLLQETGLGVGMSAGAVAMYIVSQGERFANGVPKRATRFYGGLVPTAILGTIGGRVWVPVVAGAVQTFSPTHWLSINGYAELAPGFDFNAKVSPTALDEATGKDEKLSEDKLRELFDEAVSWDYGFGFGWRAGVDATFHLGEAFDLSVRGGAGNVGSDVGFNAQLVLTMRWDDIVPAVLPKK